MELLLRARYPTNEEAQTQTQKDVCKDRTKNSSLDDRNQISVCADTVIPIIFLDEHHKEHYFHNRSQCSLNQYSSHFSHLPSQFLARDANEVRGRDHCDVADGKAPRVEVWPCEVEANRGGTERPEHVNPSKRCA